MQKLLKLQHHRHTGRKIAHHHTSYRGLAAVLLACGLAMMMIQKASADSYIVSAKVPVDIPTTASEITDPPSGQVYTDPSVTFSGTCEIMTPATVVSIWSNGNLLGSAVCANDGTFSIPVTLLAGLNNITPKTDTILNDPGPNGSIWTGTYNPPAPPTPPAPSSGGSGNSSGQTPESPPASSGGGTTSVPALSVSDAFIVYKPFQQVTLVVVIAQSDSPYTLTTNWGDGTIDKNTFTKAGRHELQHVYKQAGNFKLALNLVDGNGKVTQFVLAAVNLAPPSLVSSIKSLPKFKSGFSTLTSWLIWFSYLIAVFVTFIIWLFKRRHLQSALSPVTVRGSSNRITPTKRRK